MTGGSVPGTELARRLDDHVDSQPRPRKVPWLALGEDVDLVGADVQTAVGGLDLEVTGPVDGVAGEQPSERLG